jgi:hypothetical protein
VLSLGGYGVRMEVHRQAACREQFFERPEGRGRASSSTRNAESIASLAASIVKIRSSAAHL